MPREFGDIEKIEGQWRSVLTEDRDDPSLPFLTSCRSTYCHGPTIRKPGQQRQRREVDPIP